MFLKKYQGDPKLDMKKFKSKFPKKPKNPRRTAVFISEKAAGNQIDRGKKTAMLMVANELVILHNYRNSITQQKQVGDMTPHQTPTNPPKEHTLVAKNQYSQKNENQTNIQKTHKKHQKLAQAPSEYLNPPAIASSREAKGDTFLGMFSGLLRTF